MRQNLNQELDNQVKLVTQTQAYIIEAARVIGDKQLDILSQDYKDAYDKGRTSGILGGICIIIKSQKQRIEALMKAATAYEDYGSLVMLLKRTQSLKSFSETFKSQCSPKDYPPDFGPLEANLKIQIEKTDKKAWHKMICSIKASQITTSANQSLCQPDTNLSNPYILSILNSLEAE